MKKKKLKKRIKHLEALFKAYDSTLLKMVPDIQRTKERVNKLEKDNKYYKEWMDRSGVDYKSWFNFEEKTCDTCKWYPPLMKQGDQALPCMECTADDKKMWVSKENDNGQASNS